MEDFDEENLSKPYPSKSSLASEIAEFENRAYKKGGVIQDSESDEDEDVGLTKASREKLKEKMLVEQLYQKSEELKKCQELINAIEAGKTSDPKDKRLLDLAKKQKSLLTKLDSFQAQSAKGVQELDQLKNENRLLKEKVAEQNRATGGKKENVQKKEELVGVQKELRELDADIQLMKKKNYEQAADLKKAFLVIKRELGDSVDLEALNSGWKGRSEKIAELEAKLKKLREENTGKQGLSVANMTTTSISSLSSVSTTKMGETEKKRKEIEALKEELKNKEEELKNLKLKYAAATSRAVSLDKEIKEIKGNDTGKIKVIMEKSDNDNKLIEMLRAEIAKLKKGMGGPASKGSVDLKEHEKMISEISRMQGETGELRQEKAKLIALVQQKERKVNELMGKVYRKQMGI